MQTPEEQQNSHIPRLKDYRLFTRTPLLLDETNLLFYYCEKAKYTGNYRGLFVVWQVRQNSTEPFWLNGVKLMRFVVACIFSVAFMKNCELNSASLLAISGNYFPCLKIYWTLCSLWYPIKQHEQCRATAQCSKHTFSLYPRIIALELHWGHFPWRLWAHS